MQYHDVEDLPADFAQQLLECEIRLEISTKVDMDLVSKLMGLYVVSFYLLYQLL
jgi:hypothetical protein